MPTGDIQWVRHLATGGVAIYEPRVPGLEAHLQPIKNTIQADLIPSLLGCTVVEAVEPDFTVSVFWVVF